MFTGLVEEMGEIANISRKDTSLRITIKGNSVIKNVKIGDSIAVNGICLTVTEFNFFLFNSTLTTCSGSSSALCPVCVTVSFPFSVTIAFVTHFLNAKSKYFTFIFSMSWSSSPSIHSFGVESLSVTSFPSSSLSSEICAWFIIISSDLSGIFTLNEIFINTSAYILKDG